MKTFKIHFAAFAAAAVLAALLSACQKEELQAPQSTTPPAVEPALFTKEVTLTDQSGKNSALIRLSAGDEALLKELNFSEVFELEPLFEAPQLPAVVAEDGQEQASAAKSDEESIAVEIVSEKLESGAIGLKLIFQSESEPEGAVRPRNHWTGPFNYLTTKDNMAVVGKISCHYVAFSYYNGVGWYGFGGLIYKCAPNGTWAQALGSLYMNAWVSQYHYGTAGHTVYAW